MKARLILITLLFLLALPISTLAQHRPADDDFIMPDSLAQLYDSLTAARERITADSIRMNDSLAAVNARVTADSIRMNDSLAAAEARITNDSLRLDSLRAVLGDSIQENTTQLSFARGLSFDLDGYSAWNVGHLWGVDVYPLIGDFSAGEHGDTTGNKLTDNQSIGVYVPAEGEDDGIQFPWPHTDWGHWTNGDTMKPGETYWSIAVRFDSTSLARQPTNGLKFVVGKNGNSFETSVAKASFGVGWTFISVLLSAFDTLDGSPSWADIDSCWIFNDGATSADGGSTYLVENPQLVRKSNLGAWPNPFQRYGVDEWRSEGNHNFGIVNESGRLAARNADAAQGSWLQSAASFGDHKASGSIKVQSFTGETQYPVFWSWDYHKYGMLVGANLRINDSSTYQDISFSYAVGDVIYWRAERNGAVLTISASRDGHNWTTNSMASNISGVQQVVIEPYGRGQRIYSASLGTVAFAQKAAVAGGLENMGLKIVKDSLWVQRGDSAAHILVDFFYNP